MKHAHVIGLATTMICASSASAAIIPSWRINTITPAAIVADPLLANATSISLMVELTGGSLFNVAGLDISAIPAIAGTNITYYNQIPFGSDIKPSSLLTPSIPALEFDTYVGTTTDSPPAIPGRLNGSGSAQVGIAGEFNVAWEATPNTGGTGLREIARLTFLGFPAPPVFTFPVPLSAGRVRDSLNPNTDVALPPIPLGIPEPSLGAIVALAPLVARRNRQASRQE